MGKQQQRVWNAPVMVEIEGATDPRVCKNANVDRDQTNNVSDVKARAKAGGRYNHRGGRGHDSLVGSTIKIRVGPFKGYRGRVVDVTGPSARIELYSQMRVVTVNFSCREPGAEKKFKEISNAYEHLKEEMKLSYLAQELISTDRLDPQSWCAMGNCYSLQKDNETALKNFQRAVNLKSTFAYAHTLCGHDYGTTLDLFTVSFLCLIVFLWDPHGFCQKVF